MHALLAQITASPWLISPAQAQQYLPMLQGLLEGRMPTLAEARTLAEVRAAMQPVDYVQALTGGVAQPVAGGGSGKSAGGSADQVNVRVISLSGPLLKDDQECGPYGMATYARFIESAGQNPDIHALVLKIDSPGGQVYGTQTLADAVKNCGMPVVALVSDGLMCSAAYWIGSAASAILATHETCEIGSIGVMASWADQQGKLEKDGYKFHEVYASQSTKKNADFAAARAGNYGPIQASLTAICDQFLGAVKANRGDRLDQKAATKAGAFAGDTFSASEATELGLIDGLGSLQDAINLCADLVQEQRLATPATPNSSNKMGLFDKKATFGPAMQALVGAATITAEMATAANAELTAAGIVGAALITEGSYQALETASSSLAAMTQARDQAQATMKGMSDALTAAGATDVAALVASRDEWKGKAEAYGELPGALPTSASKEKPDVSEEGGDDDAKLVASLHAKMLGE